jgi:toxin-antitoxin system PIN domain toxin
LDVNVLVALFDPMHLYHEAAHGWFAHNQEGGWASCPITENGVLRILSNPNYPGRRTTFADARERLARFRESGGHEFWPDSVSICDEDLVRSRHIQGHRQLTDVYLLALAVERGGRLATFDRNIPLPTVNGAAADHLALIEG